MDPITEMIGLTDDGAATNVTLGNELREGIDPGSELVGQRIDQLEILIQRLREARIRANGQEVS